jgi:hypothetical protein
MMTSRYRYVWRGVGGLVENEEEGVIGNQVGDGDEDQEDGSFDADSHPGYTWGLRVSSVILKMIPIMTQTRMWLPSRDEGISLVLARLGPRS